MTESGRPDRRHGRPAGERAMLEAFLDDYRDIVVRKVSRLTDDDARRSLVGSGTSVGGLVKHLRWAEYGWFDQLLQRKSDHNHRAHERSWEFTVQPAESLPTLVSEYREQCEQSRRIAARYPLDHEVPHAEFDIVSLRWIFVHMIEETARHTGQIDIMRETLDGATGFEGADG